ncbi:MAG: H-NS histone family protein [Acinetobacter sp.]|nr:MAG: H-NS histone family protein [Acinetobacter sp.]
MSTNIDDLDIQQLQALKKEADALIEKKRRERIAEAYQQLVEIAKTVGLTLNELLEYGRSKGTKSVAKRGAVAPRYRNPNNTLETWTGRGKQPRWVVAALASGKTLADLAI